jgi:hypothetical protein
VTALHASVKKAFSAKDRVDHPVYGLGTIVMVNAHHTTIDFDTAGTKKFLTSVVRLDRSEAPAPPKPVRRVKKASAK